MPPLKRPRLDDDPRCCTFGENFGLLLDWKKNEPLLATRFGLVSFREPAANEAHENIVPVWDVQGSISSSSARNLRLETTTTEEKKIKQTQLQEQPQILLKTAQSSQE